ncbi:MAG TPA: zinc-dependent alcohol dehydrogenase [Verrucomicrobiae bacterium]|jgi:threonine dehydrogenase-like Zn-dependent dehydrogenase|nr:zinc-dependent alcohol dehydrogenase [Verrucomicrobiae bacterium]
MKAVVFHDIGDIRLDNVAEPKIKDPQDAIIRLTASAICGTDLHMVRGTLSPMKPGTILGHEGVGIVEEVGPKVRNFKKGDRVVIGSTIACGNCLYCREGYFSQCNNANPNGPSAGTAFYGGPESSGPFHGLQAEFGRVPFANANLVRIPEEVTDDQAILVSDIFPTGYFGADLAQIQDGDVVVVFGCGPVGQFSIASAFLFNASRVIAVDTLPDRLAMARDQGAEIVDFNAEDPAEAIKELTGGTGADRVIDAVGVDAEPPQRGPAAEQSTKDRELFEQELKKIVPHTKARGDLWKPGQAPSQALQWAVKSVCKAGTIASIGVYPETMMWFPFGEAMNKNLTVQAGNCNHRRYIPKLLSIIRSGVILPEKILTKREPLVSAIEAFESFDRRKSGWMKVELMPQKENIAEGERFAAAA